MVKFIEDSRAHGASVAVPGVGAVIAQLVTPPAGSYAVRTTTGQAGTVDTSTRNMQLRKGATTLVDLPSTASPQDTELEQITVNGTQNIEVIAISAGGAGSVYMATLVANRIA